MPGQDRLSFKSGMIKKVAEARAAGVNQVVVFPKTPDDLKTAREREGAFNPRRFGTTINLVVEGYVSGFGGLYRRGVGSVQYDGSRWYGSIGRGDFERRDGVLLVPTSVSQAESGKDVISPSDMMDGESWGDQTSIGRRRVYKRSIMSYTAKYNSAYYGPFREALDSGYRQVTHGWKIPKDKAEYQMDPANVRECLRESALDEAEGADIMMVKPAGAYLDIIKMLKDNTTLSMPAIVPARHHVERPLQPGTWTKDRRCWNR